MPFVKILNLSDNKTPAFQTPEAAGFDIASNEDVILYPRHLHAVRTGLKMIIPKGWEGQIRPRSSVGLRGVYIPNSPGTIDADYRGELKVILHNLSTATFRIHKGDRIAQMIISEINTTTMEDITPEEFDAYADTERGVGGFGSTGIK